MQIVNRIFFSVILGFLMQLSVAAQNILDLADLDETVNSTVAYSVRKLSSAYTGYCMQVRRSSDNALLDIGFTAGGDLDKSSLLAFVGTDDGFVVIWYDQSGNNKNLTQASNAKQPRIVNSGNIELENTKPFIRFFGQVNTSAYNSLNLVSEMTITGHVAIVNKFANGGDGFILGHSADLIRDWHSNLSSNLLIDLSNASTSIKNGKYWQNGSSVAPGSAVFNTTLMVQSIAPLTPNDKTRWNNIGSDRNLYHHTNNGGGYAELIAFSSELKTYSRNYLAENQGIYFGTGTTPVPYLNRFGKMVIAESEYLNRNGGLGTSGMNSNGETFPRSVIADIPVTAPVSSITSYSAITGGSISSDQGANLKAGICWNTSSNPTILNSKTIDLGRSGSYTSLINGLRGNTTYYIRSYASNYLGIKYGNELSFTTAASVLPIFSGTNSVSAIKASLATVSANLYTDGGEPILEKGFCWSTSANPTIADFKSSTTNPSTGLFSANLTDLTLATTYYVRAYATTSLGTTYNDPVQFSTSSVLSVGEKYYGGTIAYILTASDPGYISGETHGLVVANSDANIINIPWSTALSSSLNTSNEIGTGRSNTALISAYTGANISYAAYLCSSQTIGGYSDWYLPSKDELYKIYLNKAQLPGFRNSRYWTSTQNSASLTTAWYQDFNVGVQASLSVSIRCYVRPVRSF